MRYLLGMDLIPVATIADSFGVSDRTVNRWLAAGRIGHYRFSRKAYVPREEIQRFLKQHYCPPREGESEPPPMPFGWVMKSLEKEPTETPSLDAAQASELMARSGRF